MYLPVSPKGRKVVKIPAKCLGELKESLRRLMKRDDLKILGTALKYVEVLESL